MDDGPIQARDPAGMRVFRIAVPVSQIDASCAFYESLLDVAVDDTVPSRLYFHCGDVILALIDWTVEGRSDLRPIPDNVYLGSRARCRLLAGNESRRAHHLADRAAAVG